MTSRSLLAPLAFAALVAVSCDPQLADWGFEAILTMKTPPDDPNLGCGVQIPADTLGAERANCAFGPGATVTDTLGIASNLLAAIPIRHVIVMMKENRSYDELFGQLTSEGQPDSEPVPASYFNPDLSGDAIFPFHENTTCVPWDPGHQSISVAECIDDDRMDGFVKNAATTTGTDGHFAMGYYENTDLPFYYFLANTFALGDRHFAPMATGTYANRDFLMFATNAGVVDTGIVYPPPNTLSIMRVLMNAGYTWGAYTDSAPFSGALDWPHSYPGVHSMQDLYDALDQGTLPNVAFVDGIENVQDDHPTADLQAGEDWSKTIYDHAIASPQWDRLAIIWTYDEAGAFADHVPPEPLQCAATPTSPFTEMGPRVPIAAISPWAKRGYVSHITHDHTAITRFIEAVFDLPAMTARDANSDALFDLFDFSCGRDLSVPAAPAPGTGGCAHPPPISPD